jgi:hypothetical protein
MLYSLAYLNAALYIGYFMLWLFGWVGYPTGWNDGVYLLGFACLILPLVPIAVLSMKFKFDLLRMSDGTSMPSRFIWSALSMSLTLLMLYAFVVEIVL